MCTVISWMTGRGGHTTHILAAPLLLFKIFLAAGQVGARPVENRIVATVHTEAISQEDVVNRVRFVLLSSGRPTTPELMKMLSEQVLQQLVDEALQRQLMAKYKIEVSEESVANHIAGIEKQNRMKKGEFWKFFDVNGIPRATFLQQMKTQMRWAQYIQGLYGNQVMISAKDIARAKAKWAQDHTGTLYRVGEIIFYVRPNEGLAKAQQRGQQVLDLLSQGASFIKLAQQFSQAPTRATGAITVWRNLRRMEPAAQKLIKNAQIGDIIGPVVLPSLARPSKVAIFVLLDAKEPIELHLRPPTDEECAAEVRSETLERCSKKEIDNLRANFFHELQEEQSQEGPRGSP